MKDDLDRDKLTEDSSLDNSHDPQSAQPGEYQNNPNRNELHYLYEKQQHGKEVLKGVLLLALLHVIWVVFPLAFFGIGVAQLLYLIPAIVIALVKKRTGIAQGLILGGVITFLLNAACFGLLSMSAF
ncbi:hypothetical protein EJP77_00350 [Paenibacillus zeisoli]|uniref:Uncharacterized protein n=1 Tax=Paenibacillus zeisoli TaxID=2496267 RepID=A0A3S1BVY4_9BACL|nr:hypothetical protein [Paenibacillus zeisoli]RUT35515.1 hypothetical protein EJP77_00350 [Paenibacillus zeisoli]